MLATLTPRNTDLTDVLAESFRLDEVEGVWLPMEPGEPLVRVTVAGSGYMIERRRGVGSAWMPVVTAHVSEFDPAAFRAWRRDYQMTRQA